MSQPQPGERQPDLLWRRVGAAAIDVVILLVLSAVLSLVFRKVPFLTTLLLLGYELGAWVWWQGRTGASPGKQLVGLRVVDATGQPCGPAKAFVRWLLLIVDAFPYCLPLVWFITIFTDPREQRVGDRVAGTYVVDASRVGRRPLPAGGATAALTGPEPEWDDLRQAYVRTDPVSGRREAFDESTQTWTALDT